MLVSPKPFKSHTAQQIWTCPEDRDDFIITSPCSARGLIKNMWLRSPRTLQIDWVLDSHVFPFVRGCVCLRASRLHFIILDFLFSLWVLTSSVTHLACCSVQLWVWSDRAEACWVGMAYTHRPECLSLRVLLCYTQWKQMKSITGITFYWPIYYTAIQYSTLKE